MQNIPLNQLSPELIQMLLTQGMYQPIDQTNPYVNMLDPNTLAYAPSKNSTYINPFPTVGQYAGIYNPMAYEARSNRVQNPDLQANNMTMGQLERASKSGYIPDDIKRQMVENIKGL